MVHWRAQSDDADELAASLAETFFERLLVFTARRLRDVAVGEEVVQETLRRALEALRTGKVANRDALPAFLFETARNICLQRHRWPDARRARWSGSGAAARPPKTRTPWLP